MKKCVRRWLNRYKNQRFKIKFEARTGVSIEALITDCESAVYNKVGYPVFTKFRDLGGANNHGMLMHYSVTDRKPVAISKIEQRIFAHREYRFSSWQRDYRGSSLSAEPLGLIPVSDDGFSCFISSVLDHPLVFSYSKAEHLFKRIGQQPELVSNLALSGNKAGLKDELDDSTRIKSILVHLVSQFGSDNSEHFYAEFLQQRKHLFLNTPELFITLQSLMDSMYNQLKTCDLTVYEGLVHGDFKQQNILEYEDSYRVIDCQYYTYGIRLWDLAFLYSKDKNGFKKISPQLEKFVLFEEKALILFFYVIASIINVKKKRANKVMINQLSPAVQKMTELLSHLEFKD